MTFDEWLMNLTPEEVDKLPIDAWKRTREGKAKFKRHGRKKFEAWANDQTAKLKQFKELQMKGLLALVEQRLKLKPRQHTRKGAFLQYVREAKDEFLMRWCFTWKQISPTLRDKRQPGIRNDPAAFYDRQHDYINRTPRTSAL